MSFKRIIKFLVVIIFPLLINNLTFGQQGLGLPTWILSNDSDEGLQMIDWRSSNPQAVTIPGTGPVSRAATIPAINNCGEIVFIVVHSGIRNSPTDLFILPGYTFRAVDAMITNFHLPKSTLIMLVSAFAGRERILATYKTAVEMQYRFFSFGDAMLIL